MSWLRRRGSAIVKVLAVAIVAWLAWEHWPALVRAATVVADVGWIVVPAFAVFLLWNQVATLAWRDLAVASSDDAAPLSIWRLALARIEAQALNLLFPVSGDVVRAARMRDRRGPVSVALDLVACTVAEAGFAVAALALHPAVRPRGLGLALLVGVGAAVAAAWAWLPTLASALGSRVRALRFLRPGLQPAFRRAVGWHLLECFIGVGEIWLFAAALGVPLGPTSLIFVAAAVRAATTLGGFVPAQLGVAEGSLVWALTALGQPASAGLALALARRARQLLVLVAGALLLVAGKRWRLSEPRSRTCSPQTPRAARA